MKKNELKEKIRYCCNKFYDEKIKNPQLRLYLQLFVENIKNEETRFCIEVLFSCVMDIMLFVFYLYQTVLNIVGNIWRFTNPVLYLFLLLGKVNIFLMGKHKKHYAFIKPFTGRTVTVNISTSVMSSIVLMLVGILAMSRTYQYIMAEKALIFPDTIYILNGSILVVRMITRIMGKGTISGECSRLYTYRRAYVWAENMIAFSILFSNLIEMYQWSDKDLTFSNILFGQMVGLGVLIKGFHLFKTSSTILNYKK